MIAFLFSHEISCNNFLTISDKAQILRPLTNFNINMINLAEVQKTSRDKGETKERNRTYIFKKKARTVENLKGMVKKHNTFSRRKQTTTENMEA